MNTIIKATIAYWVLLFSLRIVGRRAVSQLSPFELIVIFLLGGMTIQAVVSDDRSMINAVAGVFTIITNHVLASILKVHSRTFQKLVDGVPVVVVRNGELDHSRLRSLRMLTEDVLAAARQDGLHEMEQIELAVVERDGSVSIIKKQ